MTIEDGDPKKEQERFADVAWIFDVDGVITDPEKKIVGDPDLFDEIIKRLQIHEPVALVTGRALEWVSERIVLQLESTIDDPKLLDNLFVSGEFGGSNLIYENGVGKQFVNKSLSVPQEIIDQALKITQDDFSNYMQFDTDKKTMVSIEMKDGLSVEQFKPRQKELIPKLKQILANHPRKTEFEIHEDLIATNIRDKRANKAYATQQLIDWLKGKKIKPKQYIAVGDIGETWKWEKSFTKTIYHLPLFLLAIGKRFGEKNIRFQLLTRKAYLTKALWNI